jgi:hypothetical protein
MPVTRHSRDQAQRLRALPAADVQDGHPIFHMVGQLTGNQLLANDIAEVAQPLDPPTLAGLKAAHAVLSRAACVSVLTRLRVNPPR